jgi:hypothetical protein
VHVSPVLNWVNVVVSGVPGAAVPEADKGVPLLQDTETGTLAVGPLGE